MKEGIVKYSEEFVNSVGLKKWRGIELPFDMNTENPLDVFAKAERIVVQSQGNSKEVVFEGASIPVIQIDKEEKATGLYIEDIMSCKSVKVLDAYASLVANNEKLKEAWERRRSQLLQSSPFN